MTSEFALIKRYFQRPVPDGFLGVGDDCAMLPVPEGHHLVTTTDLLLEGRHFLQDADSFSLGHKALAVNVSDLAAMGARPLGSLLGLALPNVNHDWLERFSAGFHDYARQTGCPLIGGDTTRSHDGITISVTVMGYVDAAQALRRSAARIGDDIWVSGTLGAPDIALALLQGRLPDNADLLTATRPALEKPMPPFRFAAQLCGVANAALDISDGLAQDLGHILEASRCGADVFFEHLPVDPALASVDPEIRTHAVLAGGDVYQLCFTAAPECREQIAALARREAVRVTRVGTITTERGLRVLNPDGTLISLAQAGFDHFRT